MLDDIRWHDEARCQDSDPEIFFPEGAGSHDYKQAKKVCNACSVRIECLNYAMVNGEKLGIWGGMSENERRRYRRLLKVGAGGVEPPSTQF